MEQGWGMFPISVDYRMGCWIVMTHAWIESNSSVPFDDFIAMTSIAPIFAFSNYEEAKHFAKCKSPRWPVDFQLRFLNRSAEWWFSTVMLQFLDYRLWLMSEDYELNVATRSV